MSELDSARLAAAHLRRCVDALNVAMEAAKNNGLDYSLLGNRVSDGERVYLSSYGPLKLLDLRKVTPL